MYSLSCEKCGGHLPNLADIDNDWEKIYDEIAQRIINGEKDNINADLHLKTAKTLMKAVRKALGENLPYDSERAVLVEYLQRNIYAFSQAKSFFQMQYYRDMMIGEDGKILDYNAYRKRIADTGELFNNTHLETEYNHAYQSAIMAHKWEALDTEYLEYSTVGDSNVRPEHAALDKFTAPKTDPVWRRIYPPNGWNCRCTVIPGKAINSEKKMTAIEAGKMMKKHLKDTLFDNNVGLSRVIFENNHPYFINANSKNKLPNLSWEQYGLPNIEKIRAEILPTYEPTTKDEYFDWWAKQSKIKGTDDIAVKDVLGQEILLDSVEGKKGNPADFYKTHILIKKDERRFEYATKTTDILTNPDEIWLDEKGFKGYIKYYEQGSIKVGVSPEMKAETIFLFDKSGAIERSRRGILLYKK